MRVVIKAYSVLRDYLGDSLELNLESPLTVKELLKMLREAHGLPTDIDVIVIVNGEIINDENRLIQGDTVIHLAPPFSGGTKLADVKILREDDKIDFNQLFEKLTRLDPEAGALSIFVGFVKGTVNGITVHELEYTAIEDFSLKQLEKIAREEMEKWNLEAVVIWHYTGKRKPGDVTVVIATVAKDRASAVNATFQVLERVKKEVPIFKLEKRSDGEYWVIGERERRLRKRT